MEQLRDLGIGAAAERLYLRLLDDGVSRGPEPAGGEGPADRAGAGAGTAAGPDEEEAAAAELVAAGLARRGDDGRLVVCPPQLALESMARDLVRRAERARADAESLSQLWDSRGVRRPYLEPLPSYDAAWTVLSRVQTDAAHRVRAITQGNLSSSGQRIVDGLFDALGRGVAYEVIYSTQILQEPVALRLVQQCVAAGEEARVTPVVPMNLTIVDDRWALVAARGNVGGRDRIDAVVVHASPLLTALTGVFSVLWRSAVPIGGATEAIDANDHPSRQTRQLLSYLSAGLTDESIAREFNVSERTVARRISQLQEVLGAQTRFQLGVQASRRGWL